MKNILFITVRSDYGGGPYHIDLLINKLPSNINIYMAYPIEGEPYTNIWDTNKRIKDRIYIPYRKFSPKHLLLLLKFINTNNINIVHSHGNGAGFYSRSLKLIGCKAKIIHTFHGISNQYTSKLKYVFNILSGRFLKFLTDDFILVSKGELNSGKSKAILFENKSTVIYNGIEKNTHIKSSSSNITNIVTISRFDYQKNMDLAYDIAYRFKDNPNIIFTWIGNGDNWKHLKEKAFIENVNINFIGFSKKPLEYLSKGTLYLSTSRFEGLPYALIEAASLGLPIIATNVVGNNECVKNGVTGYLYNTKEEAIEYINRFINNPILLKEMSQASIRYFEEYFTIEKMINKTIGIYSRYELD